MNKNKIKTSNVSWVNAAGLCHGCGACFSACSYQAIEITNHGRNNFPIINDNCINCGNCNKVCSGQQGNLKILNSVSFDFNNSNCFVYYANSKKTKIREMGASGGFITGYLIRLIEKHIVDGAIVAFSDGSFNDVTAGIALTREEVVRAASSKYYPVSVCGALKNTEKGKKYAVVGKGCDLASLELLQRSIAKYRNNIYLKIGIFCAHTPFANATVKLLESHGFKAGPNSKVVYRDKGWPGKTILKDIDREVQLDYKKSWCGQLGSTLNMPYRCAICTESFAECADIAVGDAWVLNPNLENKEEGVSLVLAFTEKGRGILEHLKNSEDLEVTEVQKRILKLSQKNLLEKQKRAYYILFLLRLLNRISPIDHISHKNLVRQMLLLIQRKQFSIKHFLKAFKFIIFKFVRELSCNNPK